MRAQRSKLGISQSKKRVQAQPLSVNPRHALTKEERQAVKDNRQGRKPSGASKLAHYAVTRTLGKSRPTPANAVEGPSWWTTQPRDGFTAECERRTQE